MSDYHDALKLAQQTALAAGGTLRHLAPARRSVDSSSGRDIKLAADREAESIILQMLTAQSTFPILSEERGLTGKLEKDSPFWIVDPIDGTMNYLRDIGLGCVSIALWLGDVPVLGVIYDFNRDELFSGLVGVGAWCNDQAMHVSQTESTAQAILATGFPVWRDYDTGALETFVSQVQAFKKVRMFGSAALSLAYVACARVDAYWEDGIQLWDVAAGLALIQAAGGWLSCQAVSDSGYLQNVKAASNAGLFGKEAE